MTAGSWTVGTYSGQNTTVYSNKSWSGTNGKTEPWSGGIRLKWNNYTMTHFKISGFRPTSVTNPINGQVLSGVGVGVISDTLPSSLKSRCKWTANDDLRTLSKLAENIRGHSFDLGINLAESKESYHTIVGNLRALGKALVYVKHGKFGLALRQLRAPGRRRYHLTSKDISGRWLELQYAWLPLVSQSYEAAKSLEANTGPRVLKFSASVASKRATYNGSQGAQYIYPVQVTYNKRLRAELYEDIGIGRSLGLVDPLQIAWEVVPYSFVVDWFLPIGTYLSVWSMIPSLTGRFMTTERIGQKAGKWTFDPGVCNPNLGCYYQLKDSTSIETWFSTTRTVSSSLSVPHPTWNPPPLALSPKRIFNAVALIHQLLK